MTTERARNITPRAMVNAVDAPKKRAQPMRRRSDHALAPITFWAVGRLDSKVAIKLNDLQAILMTPTDATDIAEALTNEAHAVKAKRGQQ